MPAPSQTTTGTFALSASWLIAVSLGMAGLVSYASRPGLADRSPSRWPTGALPHAASDTELLLFVHALCPCSQASLSELERLLADLHPSPRSRIVLWTDAEQPRRFDDSPLRDRALRMAGVEVVEDPDGTIAHRFGARTSGQLLVYGGDGRRLFAGGITPGRGHEGDSAGGLSVRALFASDATSAATTPVFGCPLFEECLP